MPTETAKEPPKPPIPAPAPPSPAAKLTDWAAIGRRRVGSSGNNGSSTEPTPEQIHAARRLRDLSRNLADTPPAVVAAVLREMADELAPSNGGGR